MNLFTLIRRIFILSASYPNLLEGTRSLIRSLRLASGDGEWTERNVTYLYYKKLTLENRICPGRHLADKSIWIVVATILSTLSISKAKDEKGQEITPEIAFEVTVTAQVLIPFRS
jgi:hypothetical protein